ncbi:MAG: hypothetical protein E6H67_15795, partial [Betaproteobacteria bacterium]
CAPAAPAEPAAPVEPVGPAGPAGPVGPVDPPVIVAHVHPPEPLDCGAWFTLHPWGSWNPLVTPTTGLAAVPLMTTPAPPVTLATYPPCGGAK